MAVSMLSVSDLRFHRIIRAVYTSASLETDLARLRRNNRT